MGINPLEFAEILEESAAASEMGDRAEDPVSPLTPHQEEILSRALGDTVLGSIRGAREQSAGNVAQLPFRQND